MPSLAESAPSCQAPNVCSGTPTLSPLLQRWLAEQTTLNLATLLFASPSPLATRLLLMQLGLDAASADFLGACVYWRLVMDGPFYKFNAPCQHPAYQPGDSWLEELGIGETVFKRVRTTVATKNVTGHALRDTLTATTLASLVLYWTDETRLTWYDVRLELLCQKLSQALGILVTTARPDPQTTLAPAVRQAAASGAPLPGRSVSDPALSAIQKAPSSAEATPVSTQLVTIPLSPPLLKKTEKPPLTSSIYKEKEEEEEEGSETEAAVAATASQLQERGVWEIPAWEIAERAHAAGLTTEETLALFEQHRQQLAHCGRKRRASHEVLAMAIARMQRQPLMAPDNTARRRALAPRLHPEPEALTPPPTPSPRAAQVSPDEAPHSDRLASSSEPAPPPQEAAPEVRLWRAVLDAVRYQTTRAVFETWLRGTYLAEVVGNSYTIAAPTAQAAEWLAHRLNRLLTAALSAQVGRAVLLRFIVTPQKVAS